MRRLHPVRVQRSVDQEDLCVCFYCRIANPRGDELESPAEKGVIWKSERDAERERVERERACSSEQRARMHERDRRRRSRQQRMMSWRFTVLNTEADHMFRFHSSCINRIACITWIHSMHHVSCISEVHPPPAPLRSTCIVFIGPVQSNRPGCGLIRKKENRARANRPG